MTEDKEVELTEEEAYNILSPYFDIEEKTEETINKPKLRKPSKKNVPEESSIPKKKRIASPCILFVSEMLRKFKLEQSEIPYKERMKIAHDMWREKQKDKK